MRPPRPMAGAPYSFRLRRAVCNTFPRPQQLCQDDYCVTLTCILLGGMSKFFLTSTNCKLQGKLQREFPQGYRGISEEPQKPLPQSPHSEEFRQKHPKPSPFVPRVSFGRKPSAADFGRKRRNSPSGAVFRPCGAGNGAVRGIPELAPLRGFEPPACRLGGGRSILLSYKGR